ncbi:glycosyltransferase [Coprothermobacteraceae bacterium]|nr:glycosyltransferase [Coprothermobacteraceae bacterium]
MGFALLTRGLCLAVFFFALYTFLDLLINLRSMRVVKPSSFSEGPMVSLLVPARNEERNIGRCVESLLRQDYPNFEVIVYDDESEDLTLEILQSFNDPRLRVISGRGLPEGWTGKNWACHNLALAARGEYLIFLDADTEAHPQLVASVVREALSRGIRAASGIPFEVMKTLGEQLIVSFQYWTMAAAFPFALSNAVKLFGGVSIALGQFMFFHKDLYWSIGGHQAVKDRITEDMALASLVRAQGERFYLFRLRELLKCRMYQGFNSAVRGFGRSYASVFDFHRLPTAIVWGWIGLSGLYPWSAALRGIPLAQYALAFQLLTWMTLVFAFRAPWTVILLNPLVYLVNAYTALHGVTLHQRGELEWKGRAPAVVTEEVER